MELLTKMDLYSVGVGVAAGIFYCRFCIKHCLNKKESAPHVLFGIMGWGNSVVGAIIASQFNMCMGLVILYYKIVVFPYAFAPPSENGPVA